MSVLSLDIIILLVIFFLLFFSSFKFGKKILVTLILSIYPALLISSNFSFLKLENLFQEAMGFLGIYIILIAILWRNIHTNKLYTIFRKIFDYGILSFFYLAMVISISSNQIPGLQKLYTFSGLIPDFVNKINFSLILILPIILIFITNKKDSN